MYKITPYVKHIFKDLNCNKLFIFTKIVKDFDNMCQNLKKMLIVINVLFSTYFYSANL